MGVEDWEGLGAFIIRVDAGRGGGVMFKYVCTKLESKFLTCQDEVVSPKLQHSA